MHPLHGTCNKVVNWAFLKQKDLFKAFFHFFLCSRTDGWSAVLRLRAGRRTSPDHNNSVQPFLSRAGKPLLKTDGRASQWRGCVWHDVTGRPMAAPSGGRALACVLIESAQFVLVRRAEAQLPQAVTADPSASITPRAISCALRQKLRSRRLNLTALRAHEDASDVCCAEASRMNMDKRRVWYNEEGSLFFVVNAGHTAESLQRPAGMDNLNIAHHCAVQRKL